MSTAWERFVDPRGWKEVLHFSPLPPVRSVPETLIQHLNFSQVAGRDCISLAPSSDGLSSFASRRACLYFSSLGQEGEVLLERPTFFKEISCFTSQMRMFCCTSDEFSPLWKEKCLGLQ